jgi:pimeloyl-ACP methyl ester carboxylesterase
MKLGRPSIRREALGGPDVEWWETRAGIVRARRSPCDRGPRLLFASDGPNVLEHYDGLFDALRGRADVVVYEPPGTGGSFPSRDFGFRLDDFVVNAEEVLKLVGPRVLVFPCYMSFVAGALSRSGRADVLGVVLPQGPSWRQMRRWMERVDPKRILRTPILGQTVLGLFPRRVARGWYAGSASPAAREPLAAIADLALSRGGCFHLASLTQRFDEGADTRDDLGSVPSVVAWGDLDRSHGRPADVTYPRASSIVHFDTCGHSPELEAPRRFADWLLAWCAETGLAGA